MVLCSYNHEDFLNESLESVASQTVQPSQLIVTDDASSDRSAQVIASWVDENWPTAELIMNQTNSGLPATLNKVVPLLTGDLVVIMSADDVMVPTRIERQLSVFEEGGSALGMVYSDMVEIDELGIPTGDRWFDRCRMGPPPGSGDLFEAMIRRAFMAAPTVMVRRSLLQIAGPYDQSLVAEDYDMFLRLSRLANWAYIEDPLVDYRVLRTSLSRSAPFRQNLREGRIRMLRKHLGVGAATDRIIADRTARMAKSLYYEGRRASLTAADIRPALQIRVDLRDLALFMLATCRVPGTVVARVIAASRRIRTSLPFGRSAFGRGSTIRRSTAVEESLRAERSG